MKKKNVYKIFMIIFWSLTFISLIIPYGFRYLEELVLSISYMGINDRF